MKPSRDDKTGDGERGSSARRPPGRRDSSSPTTSPPGRARRDGRGGPRPPATTTSTIPRSPPPAPPAEALDPFPPSSPAASSGARRTETPPRAGRGGSGGPSSRESTTTGSGPSTRREGGVAPPKTEKAEKGGAGFSFDGWREEDNGALSRERAGTGRIGSSATATAAAAAGRAAVGGKKKEGPEILPSPLLSPPAAMAAKPGQVAVNRSGKAGRPPPPVPLAGSGGPRTPARAAAKTPEVVPVADPPSAVRGGGGVLSGGSARPPPTGAGGRPEIAPAAGPDTEPFGAGRDFSRSPRGHAWDIAGRIGGRAYRGSSSPTPGAATVPGTGAERAAEAEVEEAEDGAESSAAFSAYVVPENGGVDAARRRQHREGRRSARQERVYRDETEEVYDGVALPSAGGGGNGEEAQGESPTKRRLLLGSVALCAVVAAAVAAAVFTGAHKPAPSADAPAGTVVPLIDIAPPTAPPLSERYVAIESIVAAAADDATAAAFEDKASPQSRALAWLADEDERQVGLGEERGLVQRFALAALFFATGGGRGSWTEDFLFLSGEHECEWNAGDIGVECFDDSGIVQKIAIPSNNLSGPLPPELSLLDGLFELNLSDNELSGSLPSSLGLLEQLSILALDNNSLTGVIPPLPPSLQFLQLEVNSLNGTIPTSLGRLTNLLALFLGFNKLSGPIPKELNGLGNLEILFLSSNSLSGNLSFIVPGSFPKLDGISIGENYLTGSLPAALFGMQNLTNVNFNTNLLSGSLPTEVGDLVNLELLHIHDNYLNGALPLSLFGLARMDWLSVALNEFSGSLPTEMSHFGGRYLYLSTNNFGGTLPDSIGGMTNLEELFLHRNELNGTMPQSVANLKSLVSNPKAVLTLHNNSFTGDLGFLCGSPPGILSADCYDYDADLRCPCCTSCCSDTLGFVGPDFLGCFQPR